MNYRDISWRYAGCANKNSPWKSFAYQQRKKKNSAKLSHFITWVLPQHILQNLNFEVHFFSNEQSQLRPGYSRNTKNQTVQSFFILTVLTFLRISSSSCQDNLFNVKSFHGKCFNMRVNVSSLLSSLLWPLRKKIIHDSKISKIVILCNGNVKSKITSWLIFVQPSNTWIARNYVCKS